MSERADDHVHGEERNDLPPGWVLILNQADLNWSIPGTLTTTTTVTTLTLQTWCWTRNTCWMTWTSTQRGNSIRWMWTRRLVWASLGNSFLAKKNVGVHLVQHPRLGFGRAPGWTWNGKSAEMSTLQHCFHDFHFKLSTSTIFASGPVSQVFYQDLCGQVKALSHEHNYHHPEEETLPEGDDLHDPGTVVGHQQAKKQNHPIQSFQPSTQKPLSEWGFGGRWRSWTRCWRRTTATRTASSPSQSSCRPIMLVALMGSSWGKWKMKPDKMSFGQHVLVVLMELRWGGRGL